MEQTASGAPTGTNGHRPDGHRRNRATANATATRGDAPGSERGTRHTPDLGSPWRHRILTAVGLLLAAAVFAYGCTVGQSASETASDPAIVQQYPAPGGRALRQTSLGAELLPGYDGRLTVNGVEIPEAQLEGAIDPSTVTPDQLRQFGIRPQNRNRVVFRPGPGKVIEELEPGEVTIVLRYFQDRREDSTSRTASWTVTVT